MGPNLIQWSSKKQKVVALSSTEAEYRALAYTAIEIAWLQSLFTELGSQINGTPVIWCGNVSVGALAANPVFHARTKHIEIDAHYIRKQVLTKKLHIQYVPSKLQIVDLLRKALSVTQFTELRKRLNVVSQENI